MHGSKEYVNSLTKKEKDNIVLMINIDSILAGDNLYLYGGRINDKGVVKDVEAVNKAFEIAKKANLPMQLTPKEMLIIHIQQGKREVTMLHLVI